MKKIFLSFGLITIFAIFATVSRKNLGTGTDQLLTQNLTLSDTNTSMPTEPVNGNSQGSAPAETIKPVSEAPASVPVKTPTKTPVTSPKPVSTPSPTPTPAPITPPKQTGQYKDGSYTGSVADAYYGYIQVQAVVSGGKLTDVIFLQYPNDRRTSIEINTQAMRYLKIEALQAQSANVDIVSGASDSSQAFIESLGTALAMAKN